MHNATVSNVVMKCLLSLPYLLCHVFLPHFLILSSCLRHLFPAHYLHCFSFLLVMSCILFYCLTLSSFSLLPTVFLPRSLSLSFSLLSCISNLLSPLFPVFCVISLTSTPLSPLFSVLYHLFLLNSLHFSSVFRVVSLIYTPLSPSVLCFPCYVTFPLCVPLSLPLSSVPPLCSVLP